MTSNALPEPDGLAAAVRAGQRQALAAALNLLDNQRPDSRRAAARFLTQLRLGRAGTEGRLIGITGPPGVGKSSLCAALIDVWRRRGLTVGVLAVDPSSPVSGGALLGDRLRMKTSSEDDGVFVRSLACRGEYGGLSAEVWPMSLVMMAAFDITLIETVGVGQREVDVSRICDTTCYVAQPGSGDSVQFLKAGILEVPHILVVNKEDMGPVARRTLSELDAAMSREHGDGQWQVQVLSASATQGSGVEALADAMAAHHALLESSDALGRRRQQAETHWLRKRLLEEFGSFGIAQVGSEAGLEQRLQASDADVFELYEKLRRDLASNFDTTDDSVTP